MSWGAEKKSSAESAVRSERAWFAERLAKIPPDSLWKEDDAFRTLIEEMRARCSESP